MRILTIAKEGATEIRTRFSIYISNKAELIKVAKELKSLPEGFTYAEVYVKVADLIRDNGKGNLILDDVIEVKFND